MSIANRFSSPSRRRFGLGTLAVAALGTGLLAAASAGAQTAFPSKNITIIVPFSAGGTTDILARIVGQALSTELGQPVVIDNRPGGKQIIGTDAVVKAPADGYTLLLGSVTKHVLAHSSSDVFIAGHAVD